MKKRLIFAVLGAVLCVALTAQVPDAGPPAEPEGAATWKSLGPTGGNAAALVANPANPNEVYAVSAGNEGQVFRSTTGGAAWTRQAVFTEQIHDLALAPGNPNVIYALGYNNIYKSLNKGVTWTPYRLGDYSQAWGGRIYISSANPNVMFVAGSRTYETSPNYLSCMAIFRSTNGGVTWTATPLQPTTDYAYMQFIAGNAAQPQTLYAAGYGHSQSGITTYYIYKSANGGVTWAKIAEPQGALYGLLVHPADANRVWYSTWDGVFRSSNGGSSWEPNVGYLSATALAMDRTNPQTLYAGAAKQCYKSTDGGIYWTASESQPPGTGRDILAGGAQVLYGTTGGIFRSTDAGRTFAASQNGFRASDIAALASAPSAPSTLYAESAGAGFFKSTNGGTSWKALPYFYRCEAILKIFVESADARKLFILAGG